MHKRFGNSENVVHVEAGATRKIVHTVAHVEVQVTREIIHVEAEATRQVVNQVCRICARRSLPRMTDDWLGDHWHTAYVNHSHSILCFIEPQSRPANTAVCTRSAVPSNE